MKFVTLATLALALSSLTTLHAQQRGTCANPYCGSVPAPPPPPPQPPRGTCSNPYCGSVPAPPPPPPPTK